MRVGGWRQVYYLHDAVKHISNNGGHIVQYSYLDGM